MNNVNVHLNVVGGVGFNANAENNEVATNGGTVGRDVFGGRVSIETASGNEVLLKNGATANKVRGSYSDVYGDVENNKVTIDEGTV